MVPVEHTYVRRHDVAGLVMRPAHASACCRAESLEPLPLVAGRRVGCDDHSSVLFKKMQRCLQRQAHVCTSPDFRSYRRRLILPDETLPSTEYSLKSADNLVFVVVCSIRPSFMVVPVNRRKLTRCAHKRSTRQPAAHSSSNGRALPGPHAQQPCRHCQTVLCLCLTEVPASAQTLAHQRP